MMTEGSKWQLFIPPQFAYGQQGSGCDIGASTKIWHLSHVLKGTRIRENCNIGQNVVIGPDVAIGKNCKIQNNVRVYKRVTLEYSVFCGPSMVFTNVYKYIKMDQLRPTLIRRGGNHRCQCDDRLGWACPCGKRLEAGLKCATCGASVLRAPDWLRRSSGPAGPGGRHPCGRHYDHKMSTIFFREMSIPEPHYHLGVASGSHGRQTGQMMIRIEELLLHEKPDGVLLHGDTNSTLAGLLAALERAMGGHLEVYRWYFSAAMK